MPPNPSRCAVQNTVVGTVASASYERGLTTLARSAVAVGFPCVVVQPFADFPALHGNEHLEPLASPLLLPRSIWCTNPALRHQYGWRRSQLYRARLWRVAVEHGLDLLAMDLDHMLGQVSPVPFLRRLYAPPEGSSDLPLTPTSHQPMGADVVAVWDGPGSRYLNVGIMWIRSTPATLELARRSENRTWSGWERACFDPLSNATTTRPAPCSHHPITQLPNHPPLLLLPRAFAPLRQGDGSSVRSSNLGHPAEAIFNEELNFNPDVSSIRCCHTRCLKRFAVASNATRKLPGKTADGTRARASLEGEDRCDDAAPFAAYPPTASREPWKSRWTPDQEVLRSKHSQNRKTGRCNHEFNVCVQVDDRNQVSHWANVHALPEKAVPRELVKNLPPSNCTVIRGVGSEG